MSEGGLPQKEVDSLTEELRAVDKPARAELLAALRYMVAQHCGTSSGQLDSMALSANAEAMKLLAAEGLLEITDIHGRRVIARWVIPGAEAGEAEPLTT